MVVCIRSVMVSLFLMLKREADVLISHSPFTVFVSLDGVEGVDSWTSGKEININCAHQIHIFFINKTHNQIWFF